MPSAATLPELIADAQASEERFLRQIFVRDQMAEWSKHPLVMARADDVYYWDVSGRKYLDAISGIYVASVGHNNRRVIEALSHRASTTMQETALSLRNLHSSRIASSISSLSPKSSAQMIMLKDVLVRP